MFFGASDAVSTLIAVLIVGFAVWRHLRTGAVRPVMLAVPPIVILLVSLATLPTDLADAPWKLLALGLAFVAGGAVGWAHTRRTGLYFDSRSGRVIQRGSQVALGIWLLAFLARFGLRVGTVRAGGSPTLRGAAELGGTLGLLTSAAMFFTAGLFAGRGLHTYLRYRKLKAGVPGV